MSTGLMFRGLVLFLATMLLSSCGESEQSKTNDEIVAKVNMMASEIDSIKNQISTLDQKVSRASSDNLSRHMEKVAFLTVGATEFQPISTYIGTITVSVADIQPFANGSKVTLVFGNPLNATLNKVNFKIDYGSLDKDGFIKDVAEKSKDVTVTNDFRPGTWNRVHIVLDGLPTTDLGYMRVHDLEVTSIRLFGNTN